MEVRSSAEGLTGSDLGLTKDERVLGGEEGNEREDRDNTNTQGLTCRNQKSRQRPLYFILGEIKIS